MRLNRLFIYIIRLCRVALPLRAEVIKEIFLEEKNYGKQITISW